ncbi:uncharacterized protein EV422DRAFT_570838 [Fimicolochytrium jonesii]|uniref:uncharacterized protein n=1 Tax=Fimicolochytrium jonesii TaxID=1396493 RepID=UPI0022FEA7DC|nr:uncharacterized protein EV422DRAFT_570838 [Fimicolochytrium jonesii]KAI8817220.1 hypothetical protein EV422DRAFT_570838 [Fimicolochytrium jonesii]
MNLVSALLAVVALVCVSGQVEARNCKRNKVYCGSTLRSIATGNNYDPVMEATGHTDGNDLFYCTDYDGNIKWIQYCQGGCRDNDWKDDTCNW